MLVRSILSRCKGTSKKKVNKMSAGGGRLVEVRSKGQQSRVVSSWVSPSGSTPQKKMRPMNELTCCQISDDQGK
jgi:hypothetical protein